MLSQNSSGNKLIYAWCRKQRKPVLSLVPKDTCPQLCPSIQVRCLGQGSLPTWSPHPLLNHILGIGYLGPFNSLPRWPRPSRRWILGRCSGGCPHLCPRGSSWWGDGPNVGREGVKPRAKGEGDCVCTLVQTWQLTVEDPNWRSLYDWTMTAKVKERGGMKQHLPTCLWKI